MIRLKSLRVNAEKTLRQLSKDSGVGLATLVRLEQSEFDPRLSTLLAIAASLNVTVAELLGGPGPVPRHKPNSPRRTPMSNDDPKGRNAAVDKAIKSLDKWLSEYVDKGLWEDHIWTYEYNQVNQATKLVKTLLTNLKGPDTRTHE
jgi:transcriptional regulator with XRE-family HTH domain